MSVVLLTSFQAVLTRWDEKAGLRTGCGSPWISRLLSELGHEVIVANWPDYFQARAQHHRLFPLHELRDGHRGGTLQIHRDGLG